MMHTSAAYGLLLTAGVNTAGSYLGTPGQVLGSTLQVRCSCGIHGSEGKGSGQAARKDSRCNRSRGSVDQSLLESGSP